MGNRHKDKDREVNLDGIGGVNILVKADVHRSGRFSQKPLDLHMILITGIVLSRNKFSMLRIREPGGHRRICGHGQTRWLSGCGATELHCLAHRHRGEGLEHEREA